MTRPPLEFSAETLDDLMRLVFEGIESYGGRVNPTKGPNRELVGVLLELTCPRARLSRTETRGKPFGCLGELCWYLSSDKSLDFIRYYLPNYERSAEKDGTIHGAYGPRLRNGKIDQIANVTELLKRKPASRRAVVQLFDASDLNADYEDVPCTCTLQFLIRDGALQMFTNMRSNDAFMGLPHDIFCFTMLQEMVARDLGVELGTYRHAVGSLHLYDDKTEKVRQFLAEGFQATISMPPMPLGNPWSSVELLLQAEQSLRASGSFDPVILTQLDPYWGDLVRLLQVHRFAKDGRMQAVQEIGESVSWKRYKVFIEKRMSAATE